MEPIDQRVQEAFFNAVETMREIGAEIVTVDVSFLSRCLDVEFAIVSPEAANYHHSSIQKRPDLIDPSIRAMLVAGAALPAGYYLRALRWRSVIADRMKAIFDEKQIDVLLTPTVPAPAQLHDQEYFDFSGIEEPVISSFVRTTAPFNLTGQPALSVPCGMTADGLPIGLQIAGRPFADDQVLRVGSAYEQATEWVSRLPPVHVSVEAG
tara:strand:- start:2343 stop:2969 length:627 start_codon:yes stop_codon:yes gene_type:complete